MKKWQVLSKFKVSGKARSSSAGQTDYIVKTLLVNRGFTSKKDIDVFLHPVDPFALTSRDVAIDRKQLQAAIARIQKAIDAKESIVVYADYDADGITAGAIMWETLYQLGARAMPYIPHRVEEGYGLSIKGIDAVRELYDPSLIITVDHGITAREKVAYAQKQGIDVIVTDHHVKPEKLPDCPIVHTTSLCGAGVSWFVAKELLKKPQDELLALAAIGTIADMVPLVGPNRSIVKYGVAAINKTTRPGLVALVADAGLTLGSLGVYDVSHIVAPRLNAMGRLEHAMDALRLVCTKNIDKATLLASHLNLTNKERQQLTMDTLLHAKEALPKNLKKLIFISHPTYNQGVIGLVAGKLVEEFYRPTIVVAQGDEISKASARSINGFNIVEAIKSCADILIDVGGHPMAAGFTVETKNLAALEKRLVALAQKELTEDKLTRTLKIDIEIPLATAGEKLWKSLRDFEPFGFGNVEPVFATRGVAVKSVRLIGNGSKHLKLKFTTVDNEVFDAVAFGMGQLYGQLQPGTKVDIAYTVDMNTWNGNSTLQLKIKDVHIQ